MNKASTFRAGLILFEKQNLNTAEYIMAAADSLRYEVIAGGMSGMVSKFSLIFSLKGLK